MVKKIQCWEFKKCGQEKDGKCPAAFQRAGRSCWLVAGPLCGGEVQGVYAQKLPNCKLCDFYIQIKKGDSSIISRINATGSQRVPASWSGLKRVLEASELIKPNKPS
jgi:hypothetical protein